MYRLYKKNELNFSLVWIVSYVVLFSVADSFSASLGTEKIIAAPVAIVFTLLLLVFVSKHNLKEKYGLCSFDGSLRNFLYFTPLLLIMSINLWNGVTMKLSVLETVLYILSMLCVGFIEEIIFRGFLFKALYNDNVKLAIVISRVSLRIIAFLPTLRTGNLPQSTNLRIVFLPIPVHSAASSMVKPILMLLILLTSFQNTHFATMYL